MRSRIQLNTCSVTENQHNEPCPMDIDTEVSDSLDLDNTVSQLQLATASRPQPTPDCLDRVPSSLEADQVGAQAEFQPISSEGDPKAGDTVVDQPPQFQTRDHPQVKASEDIESNNAPDNSQLACRNVNRPSVVVPDNEDGGLPPISDAARTASCAKKAVSSLAPVYENSESTSCSNRVQDAGVAGVLGPSSRSPSLAVSVNGQAVVDYGKSETSCIAVSNGGQTSTSEPVSVLEEERPNSLSSLPDIPFVLEASQKEEPGFDNGNSSRINEDSSVSTVIKDNDEPAGIHSERPLSFGNNITEASSTERESAGIPSTSSNPLSVSHGERPAPNGRPAKMAVCKTAHNEKPVDRRSANDKSQRASKRKIAEVPSMIETNNAHSIIPTDPLTTPVTASFTQVFPAKKFRTYEQQSNGSDVVNDDDFAARPIGAVPTRSEPTTYKMHSTCCTASPPPLEIFRPAEESQSINHPELMDPVLRKHVWLSTTFTGQEDWTLGRGRRFENWVNVAPNERDIRPVRIFGGIVYCKDAVKQTPWTTAIFGQNTIRFYVCCQLRRPDGIPNSSAQYVELKHLCPAYIHRIVDRSRETVLKDSKMIAMLFTRYVHTQCLPLADREGLKDEHMFRVTWNIVGYEGCRCTVKKSEKVLAELIRDRRLVSREEEQKYKNRVNGIKTNCILGPTITSLLFTDGCNKELWDDGRCEEAVAAATKLNWPQTARLVNHLRHKSEHRRDLMANVQSIRKAIDKIISPSTESLVSRSWVTALRVTANGTAASGFAEMGEEYPPKETDSWASPGVPGLAALHPPPDSIGQRNCGSSSQPRRGSVSAATTCDTNGRNVSGSSMKLSGEFTAASSPRSACETFAEPTTNPNNRSAQSQNTSTQRLERLPHSSKTTEVRRGLTMQRKKPVGGADSQITLDSPSSPSQATFEPTRRVQKSPVKGNQSDSIKGKGRADSIAKITGASTPAVRRTKRKEPPAVDLELRNNESNWKRAKGCSGDDVSTLLIEVLALEEKLQVLPDTELEKERQIMFQAWRYVKLMREVYKESQKEISPSLVNSWFKIGVQMAMQEEP